MDKNKFEQAQEISRKIKHNEMKLDQLEKVKIDENTSLSLALSGKKEIDLDFSRDDLMAIVAQYEEGITDEITRLQTEFDAL